MRTSRGVGDTLLPGRSQHRSVLVRVIRTGLGSAATQAGDLSPGVAPTPERSCHIRMVRLGGKS